MARTRIYRDGKLVAEDFPVAEISDHVAEEGTVVWCDVGHPAPGDLDMIAEELGLHALAVEDAVQHHQRPKLDRYDSHLFFTAYAVTLDERTGSLDACEVAAFVTHNALVTVRKDNRYDIDRVVKRWDESADLAGHGVAFLLHGLVDDVVDSHFDTVQALDEYTEQLEDQLFVAAPRDQGVRRRSYELRKSLVLLRRAVLPMREVVNSLLRRDSKIVSDEMVPYYQDVYDHVLRAAEWTDSLRELIATIRETHLAEQSNRMDVIMKQVTSWAAIIAVPTAVTGFYGQNVPYPGFGQVSGFIASTIVTVGLSIVLYVVFRRKDWL
jgi:magnesium transporter